MRHYRIVETELGYTLQRQVLGLWWFIGGYPQLHEAEMTLDRIRRGLMQKAKQPLLERSFDRVGNEYARHQ